MSGTGPEAAFNASVSGESNTSTDSNSEPEDEVDSAATSGVPDQDAESDAAASNTSSEGERDEAEDKTEDSEPGDTEVGSEQQEPSEEDVEDEEDEQEVEGEANIEETDEDSEGGEETVDSSEATAEPEADDEDEAATDDSADSSDDDTEAGSSDSDTSSGHAGEMAIEASRIKETLSCVSVVVEECRVKIDNDGLSIRAVDPANVGMVDLSLESDAFERFDMGNGTLGINLSRLEDIISMANAEQTISFDLNERTRKLTIYIDGLEYTLALIDPASIRSEPDIPDLNLNTKVTLEGRDIDRGIKAADMVSDHVAIRSDPAEKVFSLEAEGDTDDTTLRLGPEELVDANWGVADSLYSLDYFKDFNKAIPSDAEVKVAVDEEFPTKLHFCTADNLAEVTFMLAPRISED
jgi:proliferating cell nuclear antigen